MSQINKNQNLFHLEDRTGKRTMCGLSNQYKDAVDVEHFKRYYQSMKKECCKKCESKLK